MIKKFIILLFISIFQNIKADLAKFVSDEFIIEQRQLEMERRIELERQQNIFYNRVIQEDRDLSEEDKLFFQNLVFQGYIFEFQFPALDQEGNISDWFNAMQVVCVFNRLNILQFLCTQLEMIGRLDFLYTHTSVKNESILDIALQYSSWNCCYVLFMYPYEITISQKYKEILFDFSKPVLSELIFKNEFISTAGLLLRYLIINQYIWDIRFPLLNPEIEEDFRNIADVGNIIHLCCYAARSTILLSYLCESLEFSELLDQLNMKTDRGRTAIDICISKKFWDGFVILIEYGARLSGTIPKDPLLFKDYEEYKKIGLAKRKENVREDKQLKFLENAKITRELDAKIAKKIKNHEILTDEEFNRWLSAFQKKETQIRKKIKKKEKQYFK